MSSEKTDWIHCPGPLVWLLAVGLLVGCEAPEQQAAVVAEDHGSAYMDSLRIFLGELRQMDEELERQVGVGSTVHSERIVPLIAERYQPTVLGLRTRADSLAPAPPEQAAHQALLRYLDLRLQAYDAAVQGHAENRPELFDLFASKQAEAETAGRLLQDEAQRLRRDQDAR